MVRWFIAGPEASRQIGTALLLAATYFIASKFGLMLASVNPSASPVWPPTGIALAALLLLGFRTWPGIFLGAFVANLTTEGTVWTSFGIGTGNALEALLGAFLVTKYANGRHVFDSPQDIFKFTALAALVSTTVSPTIGVTSLALGGFAPWTNYGAIWGTWWLGDAMGALIVTPLILLWAGHPTPRWDRRQLLERALFLLALVGVSWIVFGGRFPLTYLTVPFLIWSAFRFNPRETAVIIGIFSVIALCATLQGFGPFVRMTRNESLLVLQAFMGTMVLVALPLASIVAEREAANVERTRREDAQRFLAEAGTVLGTSLDPEVTLKTIAGLAVPALADWCAIDLVQDGGDLRRLVAVHRDPAKVSLANELRERYPRIPPLSYGVPEVIRTRRSHLAPEISDALLQKTIPDFEVRSVLRGLGLTSAMVVPLVARDRTLGAMTFLSAESRRRYDDADLALAEELARRAAIAVDNARLHYAEQAQRTEAERRAKRIERLQAVTAALSEAVTPEQVGESILQHAVDELGASAATVLVLVDDARSLVLLSVVGYSADIADRWRETPAEVQPIADAMRAGKVVWYGSWADFLADYPEAIVPIEQARLGARAAVPLMFHGRAIGALYMNFREDRRFDDAEQGFMLTLGRQCAQALDRARLYEAEKTAHEAAEEAAHRIQRLQAVTSALSAALTPSEVAEVILTEGLRVLNARAGIVYRLRKDDAILEMLHSTGYPADVAHHWSHNPLAESSPSAEVARTKTPMYFESHDAVISRYPGLAGKINPHVGGRAFVPLPLGDRTIGVLGFVFVHAKTFSEEERNFIQALADQCAQALERSRLYEGQRTLADTLQRAFLPLALPEVSGIRISAAYLPAAKESEIGGDWYDAFTLADGRIALCVGDVVGHGLDAAVIMGQMRQCIRAAALDDANPSSVLAKANRLLVHSHGAGTMATVLFGILDPMPMVFAYASAGHPAPVLRHRGIKAVSLALGTLPLGFPAPSVPATHEIALSPGALLVLYTDGLVELNRDIAEGEDVLRAAVEAMPPEPSTDAAHTILAAVLGDRSPADDVAVMAVGVEMAPADRVAITVPAESGAPRLIRQMLRRLATTLNLTGEQFTGLEVATGEAVNNAVEHAYGSAQGTVDVRVRREGDLWHVEVEDHGRWRPERDEGRGHGLRIMREMVNHVSVERGPAGTTVRLSLCSRGAGTAPAPVPTAIPNLVGVHTPPQERDVSVSSCSDQDVSTTSRQFEVTLVNGVPVVEVIGDIDLGNEKPFLQILNKAARQDRRALVVSLARASYIDSRGVQALLRFDFRLATNRQRLLLVVPKSSLARRILDLVGASSTYPLFDTVEEAIGETEKQLPSSPV